MFNARIIIDVYNCTTDLKLILLIIYLRRHQLVSANLKDYLQVGKGVVILVGDVDEEGHTIFATMRLL